MLQPEYELTVKGGAICGTFVIFGGLSVILYKPWRRRIDRKRVHSAHFEPLSQEFSAARPEEEELGVSDTANRSGAKDLEINVESIQVTDAAGPAPR
jgi:high-affinity nickel-transport protein